MGQDRVGAVRPGGAGPLLMVVVVVVVVPLVLLMCPSLHFQVLGFTPSARFLQSQVVYADYTERMRLNTKVP